MGMTERRQPMKPRDSRRPFVKSRFQVVRPRPVARIFLVRGNSLRSQGTYASVPEHRKNESLATTDAATAPATRQEDSTSAQFTHRNVDHLVERRVDYLQTLCWPGPPTYGL